MMQTTSENASSSSKLTIMALPGGGDSYTDCHYKAMQDQGVHVINGVFSLRWLLSNLYDVDYLHVHWPSFFYRHAHRMDSAIRFGKMCFLLGLARVRGASIIWTAHNLYPHDRNVWPLLDRLARQIVVRLAAHIFVHGPAAAKIVAAEFPAARNKLTEIWHGHWLDFYPRGCSQNEARARLGIPADVYVYGCVGACKEYKNLHKLIPAFQSVPGAAWLIIAGRFQSAEYEREVKRLVAVNPERILVVSGFIPDEDLQYFLAASNIVVMPYAEILTSGSAMLALSFGRPVIAPRRGFLEDVIVPDVGLLYDMNDHAGLVAAMIEAQRQTFNKKVILSHARQYDWDSSARKVVATLKLSRVERT